MATNPTPQSQGPDSPFRLGSGARRHLGWIVLGSMAAGLLAALAFAAAPFVPFREGSITGALLCGFALGWALLAVLSARFTEEPQRWAWAPAVFLGGCGLLLLLFGSPVHGVLNWVWPPALLVVVVWMVVRARRRLLSRSRRLLLYPVAALLALVSVAGGCETVLEAVDARAHPMAGQLVDVGGHRLHLDCTGSGSPTVVLEPGAGEMSSVLGWIAPAVASGTRVCVYDRAGRGWSEPADTPQDGAQIAADLHTLLQRGNVPGPYVLAGHSFGGLYALAFAAQYPDDVAGMVLVDSTAPAAHPGPAPPRSAGSYDLPGRVSMVISTAARLGLGRLYGQLDYGSLPPLSRDEARASSATASQLRSTIDEYVQGGSSVEEAAALRGFGGKPLVVLSAGSGSAAGWSAAQNALATLSTNSVHRTVEGATHASLVSEKEDAAATAQAILDVVSSLRSGVPLDR
ncbi:alpha/beta hydrolase [Arthrobacter sp. 35W]|uniref:alpha/beta hydrolase n=1 Tax=Arthrobacter sp. 35W TaxID=1132441 RepID=UPI0004236A97|nr:alpha/beta hydrolase [Arthrobacter sp. 35W]